MSTPTPPSTAPMQVDGRAAPAAGTVLEACLSVGADFPHFCHSGEVSSGGHCRSCMVEMDGRHVAACTTEARPGATVRTQTAVLRAYRLDLGELMLAEARNVDGQRFLGLEQLKLDNSSQDAGFMNERIATAVLRRMDMPAARTGWADVTVNGDHAGFFVLMESIDDRFLRRWYGNAEGPLFGMISAWYSQGLNPFPVGYGDPLTWYETQTSVESDGSEIAVAVERLAAGTDAEVAEVIDLDAFLRVGVARSVMGGIDTFSADGNNFYLYVDNGRLTQIPWDLDADLGYPWAYSLAMGVDPRSPWASSPWSTNPPRRAQLRRAPLLRQPRGGATAPWSSSSAITASTAATPRCG